MCHLLKKVPTIPTQITTHQPATKVKRKWYRLPYRITIAVTIVQQAKGGLAKVGGIVAKATLNQVALLLLFVTLPGTWWLFLLVTLHININMAFKHCFEF